MKNFDKGKLIDIESSSNASIVSKVKNYIED